MSGTSTRPNAERRPRRRCADCGRRTRAAVVCPDCEARLDGGRWVVVRAVLHWVPEPVTPAPAAAVDLDDNELTCARRLRAAIAESQAHDQRTGVVA